MAVRTGEQHQDRQHDGQHIEPVDAFTFTLERDPLLRATIVAVARFERAPDWDGLVERVERASRLVPRFRQKLVHVPFGLAPPRWIVDPDFDLALHLHRVRAPSAQGEEFVLDLARTAACTSFDHDRPLWRFTLVEGLPDEQAALVMQLHHALTDGVGGIEIAAHVVDLTPDPPEAAPMPPAPTSRPHDLVEVALDVAGHHAQRAVDVGTDLARALPHLLRHGLARPVATATSGLRTATSIARFVRPVTRTSSPIMRERRNLRDLAGLDVELEPLVAAAHHVDSTVNDAFLAAVAGGMRRYHEHHFAAVDHLRISMPVSVRRPGDAPGGNRVTVERLELPVGITDPVRRMRHIATICRELRADPAIPYASAIAGALNLLPVDVTASMLRHVDLLVSNVAGFPDPVWVAGARLRSFRVFGATLGSAANVTLMSYDGTCHVGISSDAGAVPDPSVLLECLQAGFDEVAAVGR